ncbi:Z1 domain-containing protein [Seleniivibrio woodruffii]|uniref:Z1 domain-containing protein n=1 Tax=Seleniivibrio woodruffii TaxID=1078050 RepID=UPI0026EF66C4|nr:Z1 domain-containing protein [Seleniivibrio woodruffii]
MGNGVRIGTIYEKFLEGMELKNKAYDDATKDCIFEAVSKMIVTTSNGERPGMLLGKIQSGKTRTFLGIISLAFDNGYDIAIVFTKGTKALAKQTVKRLVEDFDSLIQDDLIGVYDIMDIKDVGLKLYQREKKSVFVVKKEDDNLGHLRKLLFEKYPELSKLRILIVDDEADFASISYAKDKNQEVNVGKIQASINELRNNLSGNSSFLQVTATPYSLYLQPEDSFEIKSEIFKPCRPAFTVVVPIHDKYIGGDFYFRESENENSIASFLHVKVSPNEMLRLKKTDMRRLNFKEILTDYKLETLRGAVIGFVVGACIRNLQQEKMKERTKKYSFIVHTDSSRDAHRWQDNIIQALVDKFKDAINCDKELVNRLILKEYNELFSSLKLHQRDNEEYIIPEFIDVQKKVVDTFDYLDVTIVNSDSDNDVDKLLDINTGQLRLDTLYTIFVGGSILDRGLTIDNMIGFFYGREPKKFQQDTVLQHSRMYGARDKDDLPVTRFYTTDYIYNVMKNIHEFDSNLREQIEKYGNDAGVVFIERDMQNKIIPCAPNKILKSEITNLKPFKRLLPEGFQTGYPTKIKKYVQEVDKLILPIEKQNNPVLIDFKKAETILDLISETLKFSDADFEKDGQVPSAFEDLGLRWDIDAHKAAMRYISKGCAEVERQNKIWCLVKEGRGLSRLKQSGFSDAPDTKPEMKIAKEWAKDIPLLVLIKQKGDKEKGWMGAEFWWPVIIMPENCGVAVYAQSAPKRKK